MYLDWFDICILIMLYIPLFTAHPYAKRNIPIPTTLKISEEELQKLAVKEAEEEYEKLYGGE